MSFLQRRSAWLLFAIASGTFAALNGVFAKLTTTGATTSFSRSIAGALGFDASNKAVEYAIRGLFGATNLFFGIAMWGIFTRALTLASSTVRVSIINTSTNFIMTAVLGFLIFSESLPPLWWLGAAMMVAGSVIIGRREEAEKQGVAAATGEAPLLDHDGDANIERFRDEDPDEGRVELNSIENGDDDSSDEDGVLK